MAAGGGYVAEDWEIQSGDYLAKKGWINEDASLGLTEAGTKKTLSSPRQLKHGAQTANTRRDKLLHTLRKSFVP